MSEQFIPQTKADEINRQIALVVDPASQIVLVETVEQRDNANALCKAVKTCSSRLEATRKELTQPHLDAQRDVMAWFKPKIAQLETLEENLKKVIVSFERAQEVIRLEAQRKLDEEARKIREKQEADARAIREKEDAERRKADDARREAEAARIAAEQAEGEEKKRLEDEAAAKEKEAAKAESKAETLSEKADCKEQVAASVVSTTAYLAPKAAGISVSDVFKIETTDKRALVKWCLEIEMFDGMEFIEINEGALNKVVQSLKGKIIIDGATIVRSDKITSRK